MLKIKDVNIITPYGWDSVRGLGSWESLKHSLPTWGSIMQTVNTGSAYKIEVEIVEDNWNYIMWGHQDWTKVSSKYSNWLEIKNL